MKKPLIFLLTLISGIAFAGQGFDYELVRTKEAPGFFMAKIFAGKNAEIIPKKELYIKNYPKNQEKEYRELFPFLQQQRQGRLIDINEFRPEKVNPKKHIVIVLGDPLENKNYLNFQKIEGDLFKNFQNFAKKELSPIVLDNLKVEFGGNAFDVQTKQNKVTLDSPAIFIGKFNKPIKTRMSLQGETLKSKFELETALDLSNNELSKSNTAEFLPEMWEELAYPYRENPAKKSELNNNFNWGKILFYVFLFCLILFAIALIRYFFRDKEDEDSFLYESEVPIFQSEIPEQEYQKQAEKIDKKDDDDLPFEVVWKRQINE